MVDMCVVFVSDLFILIKYIHVLGYAISRNVVLVNIADGVAILEFAIVFTF